MRIILRKVIPSAWRVLRRKYYFTFRMDYVRDSIKSRQGTCNHCGMCCKDATIPCKHFDFPNCKVWNNMPIECRMYPFDEKDMDPETKQYCVFRWVRR